MQKIYLFPLFCTVLLLFSACTENERTDTDTTDVPEASEIISAENIGGEISGKDEEAPESAVPVYVSALSAENYLLPLEDYSWDREFAPEYVMLHFTSAVVNSRSDPYDMDAVRKIFEDSEISIHYIIDRDGKVQCYIPEARAAWHAGRGSFANDERLTNAMNKYSIGIEILAIGSQRDMVQYLTAAEYNALPTEYIGFTEAQYISLKGLVKDICARNSIPFDREHVIGHDMYNPLKNDPGELFEWEMLFE